MTFVPAPGTIKAELVYIMEGSYMENVLNYDVGADVTFEDLGNLAQGLVTCWNANMKPYVTPAIELAKVRCTSLDSQEAPGIEFVAGLPSIGTNGGDSLPANCSLEVILYTGLRGRSFRGRIFVPGYPEGDATGSTWAPSFRATMTTKWSTFMHITEGGVSYDLTVVSRVFNKVQRTLAETTAVTSMATSPYITSQRRRLPGRGT